MTSDIINHLNAAAQAAGEIALMHWQNAPRFWDKGDGAGPVSEADLAVNDFLADALLTQFPDHGWLSEESSDGPERLRTSDVLVVDPIDGTRSFIAGERSWAISIAIVRDRTPIAGVVHLPAIGKTYSAELGSGSFLDGKPIRASNPAEIDNASALGAKPNFQPDLWTGGVVPPLERHFRPSLAYRMALVAEGRFDAMLTHRPSWEWDLAAGAVIASEAGATVTDWYGKSPKFNNKLPKVNGVMIAGPTLHRALQGRRLERSPID